MLSRKELTESIADAGVGTGHEYRFRAHCCGISDLYKCWRRWQLGRAEKKLSYINTLALRERASARPFYSASARKRIA